jgi:hypothetical protein
MEVAMAGEDGFLSRWARRKADAREGKPLDEPALAKPVPAVAAVAAAPQQTAATAKAPNATGGPEAPEKPVAPELPPLTLQDAQALTQHSDFKPFMAQTVQPEVRNAAMKKLFADPHYNIMDGLDTYIDDYTKSDPIPESMLRQMVGAQFLKLFDDEAVAPSATVAQSTAPIVPTEPCLPPDHAHTPLRLQPDHAPAGPDAGSRPA